MFTVQSINKKLLVLFIAMFTNVALAQGLPDDLQKAWQATKIPLSDLSLDIREVNSNAIISQVQANVARNPASVMKTVTTWTALSTLGPNYTWQTSFYAQPDAYIDKQGSLPGALYIKAGGDPWFTVEDLWRSLRELRLRGIKNLTQVVIDRSFFGDVSINPGAFDDSADRPYNASPDAMMLNFGAIRVLFLADERKQQWVPIVDSPTRNINLTGKIEWLPGKCRASAPISVDVAQQGELININLVGKAIGSCGDFNVYRLIGTQTDHFESLFRLIWKELGGTLAKDIRSGTLPRQSRLLYSHQSQPLSTVIRQINKFSNNVMARMTLLTLGAKMYGHGATAPVGAKAALEILQNQGVNTNGWVLDNGSGLSRTGRLTADGLAQMLGVAWRSPMMSEFVSSLAIAGVDGTMGRRLRGAETRGQAHLKTGTLRDARALAGYVRGASGKTYTLVSMVNSANAGAVRAFDDAVVSWLTKQ